MSIDDGPDGEPMRDPVYERIYGRTRAALLREFRDEMRLAAHRRDRRSTELREFLYWLFKYRVANCEPAASHRTRARRWRSSRRSRTPPRGRRRARRVPRRRTRPTSSRASADAGMARAAPRVRHAPAARRRARPPRADRRGRPLAGRTAAAVRRAACAARRPRDGLICLLTDRIDAPLLDGRRRLRVISNVAVGYDNIDVAAATARGIPVGNTPGVLDRDDRRPRVRADPGGRAAHRRRPSASCATGAGRRGIRTCCSAATCTARRWASSASARSARRWRAARAGFGMRVLYTSRSDAPRPVTRGRVADLDDAAARSPTSSRCTCR